MLYCRRDAMSLLDALVSVVPQQVSAQFLVPALNHYSSLLSDTTGASGLRSGTQGHLLQVSLATVASELIIEAL